MSSHVCSPRGRVRHQGCRGPGDSLPCGLPSVASWCLTDGTEQDALPIPAARAGITQSTQVVDPPHAPRGSVLSGLGCLFTSPHSHCALTSSLACLDQARLHTCEPVSMHCSGWPVSVFQNRIQRSAVPPPDASSPCWCGDQAIAFTAARCSVYCCTGLRLEWFHTSSCGQAGRGCDTLTQGPGARTQGMHNPGTCAHLQDSFRDRVLKMTPRI